MKIGNQLLQLKKERNKHGHFTFSIACIDVCMFLPTCAGSYRWWVCGTVCVFLLHQDLHGKHKQRKTKQTKTKQTKNTLPPNN